MSIFRTRFKNEILTEFLPPMRATKNQRVIILAAGCPSGPNKNEVLKFLSKKGFWVFFPRYRGSWESKGRFLQKPLDQDLLDVASEIPKGFVDIWSGRKFKLKPNQIIILGGSFGGAAAILASRNKLITKAMSISPLIDQTRPGKDEPFPKMIKFYEEGYGPAFRIAKNGWAKLKSGKFFNPIKHISEINGHKNLIIHAKDDQTCPYSITKKFALLTNTPLVTLNKGDHLGLSIILQPKFYKIFLKFINEK